MNTWKLIGNFFDDEEPFDLRDFRGYTFEELNRIILYKLRIKIINERIAELEAENRSIEKKAGERILKLNKEIEMKIKSNEVMSGDEEEGREYEEITYNNRRKNKKFKFNKKY